ncbi:Glutathione S-transferase C-terminal domain-containing protein [Gracilariopsis chorda]|uniref:Glutathione S-transferase C-terminal domain-containing protein n=1 Tax=Gracilariopsis chorda TaxID=448386 RepID=A0A2V3IVU8_9FLOR|nr:Glutathione S-transferase C-terminal domain-containing protein [Gracilariopsis chorda]|eukprot:PXF45260.1 Glutathione S-transferase C-terminal domain-containing protein [Gracilariopsis chorda]
MDPLKTTIPKRVKGLDFKAAEQLTRRLLLHDAALPVYSLLPPTPPSPTVTAFLQPTGFSVLPSAVDPASKGHTGLTPRYGVPPARADNKRSQIRFLISVLAVFVDAHPNPNPVVVDFCGGCGHVALVIAAVFPQCRVYIVDGNKVALSIAKERAKSAELRNVQTYHTTVQNFSLRFDIALALHGCGGASDAVISAAVRTRAALIVVPCCVGAIVTSRGSVTGAAISHKDSVLDIFGKAKIDWHVPRSALFRSLFREGDYDCLAKAADFGEHGVDDWRKISKALLEWDRLQWLREGQYHARLAKMRPLSCTPKNDVLLAWPRTYSSSFQPEWPLDGLANGFVRDVVEGSVLNGLGLAEVTEVERMLQNLVCDANSPGVYRSSAGAGKRRRKVVHAVAESMGLWHRSDGRGTQRSVLVRRTPHWPFFLDTYVGVGGPIIEAISAAFVSKVPEHLADRRVLVRGRPHHITIVSPVEYGCLDSQYRTDRAACLELVSQQLFGTSLKVMGLGRVQRSAKPSTLVSWDGNAVEDTTSYYPNDVKHEVFFVVIEWPEAQQLRGQMGLPVKDLHITLGFTEKDIHNCRKDLNTLIYPVSSEYKLTVP